MSQPTTLLLILASLCGCATPAPAQDDARPIDVLAYYYPWYDAGDWSRHPYVGTPILGRYGSDDPAVAEQHIAWCNDAAITGLCVSWWGADSQTDRHLRAGLLAADNADDIAFCIFYESLMLDPLDGERDTAVDFAHPAVMDRLIADLRYLAATYFERDNYYRIDGRPVVGLYLTRVFRGFTAEHAARLREAVGVDLFLIGDEVYFGPQDAPATARHGAGVFDAVSAYNMHTDPRIEDGEPALDYMRRAAWPVFEHWADDPGVWFMPNVMPSYQDFRGHDTLTGDPADFERMLREAAALAANDPAATRTVIFITSFNEWWEGSTIEPAEEYSTGYLDAVARWRSGRPGPGE